MARVKHERELKQSRITVIGEGLTERWYFSHMRNIMGYRYDCKPRFFTHQSFEEMKKLIDLVLRDGGIAVCVCDADVTRVSEDECRRLNEMKEAYAGNDSVLVCDSMPSIEFWFLIHYLDTSKYFKDSAAVIRELRKFLVGYDKSGAYLEKPQWVSEMCSDNKLSVACSRASKLNSLNESYSNIYRAIKLFEDNKYSGR